MKELKSIIECLLFIANRPLDKKDLIKITGKEKKDVSQALKELTQDYQNEEKGIRIIHSNKQWQMTTDPKHGSIVQRFLKTEVNEELTPASLETLSIIAYRGPIKKQDLEEIRGVNCTIILRNLLIKGLIIEKKPDNYKNNDNELSYNVSLEFVKYLGIKDIEDLPNFKELNRGIPLSLLIDDDK
ncbi:SMC-Scp complex subunit ScpB [Patescibacteria group bacterium]|nr:SMC-Scp complex subunit ScpB [Patescibacteria group bacterium]